MAMGKGVDRFLDRLDRSEDKVGAFQVIGLALVFVIAAMIVVPQVYKAWETAPQSARDAQQTLRGL
jgi:hypothetical protein